MQIIEIYKSLQGESSYSGLPCVFVRTAGCNLRCVWCDSEYTFKGGHRLSLDEVEQEVRRLSPAGGLVEITGGEPLLQEREVAALMERLLAAGYTVLLETSGERLLDKVPNQVVKIVDVKCPHSGEGGTFRVENLEHLTPHDEVKFVVASRTDYEFARDFLHHVSDLEACRAFNQLGAARLVPIMVQGGKCRWEDVVAHRGFSAAHAIADLSELLPILEAGCCADDSG